MWEEANITGLHVRSRCWEIQSWLNGKSRARRKSSEITVLTLDAHPLLAHTPYPVLTGCKQQPFGERMVLAACSLADADAVQPDVASC